MLEFSASTLNYHSAVLGCENYVKFGFRIFYGFWSSYKKKSAVV